MKLYILTENTAGGDFAAEHGLSYLIETNDQKVLFDSGNTDIFLKNAEKLGIDLNTVNTIVLSHGHWDHGNGLSFLKNKTLITHPSSFMKRYRKRDRSYIGLNKSLEELDELFKLILTKKPYHINENLIFLGEIPRLNSFESQTTSFIDENDKDDFVLDDSALVYINNDEITIITACSHSGICNIVDHAIKVTGISKVKAVIGGFHLKHNDKLTQETIEYFKQKNITTLLPSHCTELPALSAFYKEFTIKQVKTGMILDF